MNTVETIIALIVAPTCIVGAAAFVARGFFTQLLARDLELHKQSLARETESYRLNLQKEIEISKLQLQADIQRDFFRYQTQFSHFHAKQAEAISEAYRLLFDAYESAHLMVPIIYSGDKSPQDRAIQAEQKLNDLIHYYQSNRIFLSVEVCEKMDKAIRSMKSALYAFCGAHRATNWNESSFDGTLWSQAFDEINNELEPLRKALEEQLRNTLCAEMNLSNAGQSKRD